MNKKGKQPKFSILTEFGGFHFIRLYIFVNIFIMHVADIIVILMKITCSHFVINQMSIAEN